MTDKERQALVVRLRNRIHDAPMPTEHLLDEAADQIEVDGQRIAELLALLRDCNPESMSWLDARDAALGAGQQP